MCVYLTYVNVMLDENLSYFAEFGTRSLIRWHLPYADFKSRLVGD
jgi:hypothetical protein